MDGPDDPYNREAILALLRSGNESERIAAAYQIRRLVARAGRELSGEMFCRFEEDLYNQLFRMVHATDVDEKLGGVSAVEALIGAPSAEPETKGIKFANVLSNALKQQCNVESRAASGLQHGGGSRVFVTKTAAALGRLAKRGPASSGDHVEFEVIRALEWLQHSGDSGTPRRLTACLVLRELAKHAPTLFYTKVRDFFDRIWPALVDGRSTDIRDAAASALGAALEIVSQRPTARHSHYYCSIYSHAHAALAPYIAKQSRSASEKPFADPPPLPPLHSEAASTLAARRDGRRGKQPSWWRRLLFGGDDNFLSAPPQLRRSPEQRFGAAAARSGPPPRRSGSDSAIKPKVRSSSQPAPVRIGEFRVNPPPPFEDEARSGQPPQKHQQQMQRFAAGRPSRIATTDDDEASREKKMEARLPPTTTQDKAKRIQQQRSLLEGTTRSTGGTPAIPSSTTTTTTTTTPKSRDATTPPPKSASPASRYLPSSSATEATAHGALLVVGSLLKHAGPFMMPRFREACDAAIALREHRSRAIRKAVTELLPRLAQYSPDAFSRAYLATTTQHLLKMARQRSNAWELRDASYEAIGRLALAVKHYLVPSLPELVLVICEHGLNVSPNVVPLHQRAGARSVVLDFASAPELRGVGSRGFGGAAAPDKPQHHDKSSPQPPGSAEDRRRRAVVIDCVADVVEALRDEMGPQHVDALLDALFAGGLSEPLIRALNVVSKSLPSRRPLVRARLLDELTSVLLPASGAPFAPPGWTRPASRRRLAPPPAADHLAGGGATAPRPPSGTHRQRASLFPAAAAAAVGQQQQPPPSPGALSLSGRAGAGAGVAAPPGYFLLEFDAVRVAPEREESVLLSLRALGEFSMEGVCLLPLVRDCVSRYLDCSTSSHIRAAAVVTCARLILPPKRLQLDAPTLSSRRESGGAAGRSRAKDGSRRLSLLKSLSLTEQRKGDGRRASRKSVVISGKTRLASFAEEGGGGKDEYRREYSDDEDDEDDDLDDDDDDDDEGAGLDDEDDETPDTDSSSIVTSSDATRLSATRRTLRDDVVGDDNDDVADAFHHGVDASVTSHPSDDSVPLRSNKKQSRRRSKSYRGGLTDASSRGTEDSGDSSQIYARRRARILADDTSSWGGGRRGRTATRGRRRLSSSVRDGLLLDESLRSHVDDVLPPWYFVGPSASVVDDVLRKLLRVALSDDDAIPRAAVLKALRADDRFDAHLCRAPHVDAISLLLHDEDTELQLAALALLGRLAAHNPAAVLGRVRDALARAVAALRCDASDAPAKERAARLAAAALRAESPKARRCVWPLAASVVASLPLGSRELGVRSATTKSMSAGTTISGSISGLGGLVAVARPAFSNSSIGRGPVHRRFHLEPQDDSHARLMQLGGSRLTSRAFGEDDGFRPSGARSMSRFVVANPSSVVPNRLVCASLDALAECVLVLGPRARSIVYTPRVLSPLFDALLDRSSSRKRELALKVLGRVASSAGCVVAPYLEHPPLLPRMLAVLRENYGGPSSLGTSSRGGMPWSLCREALRALGLVGALDPHKFELVQRGARDCRKHAARLAYEARDAAVARTREKAATVPVPMPTPAGANATSTSGGTQPIAIGAGPANTSASNQPSFAQSATTSTPKRAADNPNEPPLLAPYVAALLEDDEDEPAHAAMYAQSCPVAMPAVKDDPQPQRKLAKRDTLGLLEAGMNAGELAIDGAMRGDDVDAYYYLAHVVEDDDGGRDVTGDRDDDFFGDKPAHTKRRKARANSARAMNEEFYARVAIDALVRVLRDASLSAHHAAVTQALTFIIQSLGTRCIPFLPDIVPHLLDVARNCEPGLRESILLQLAALASIVRHHLREWLPRVFDLIVDYWQDHLEQVVPLLEEIATSVSEHLAPLVPRALPLLLASLAPPYAERPPKKQVAERTTSRATSVGSASNRSKQGRRTDDISRVASIGERGASEAPLFDDEPPLHASTAAAAPAALSETRLALVLRATMLLREALAEHLFLVVPALLRLADTLGDGGFSPRDASYEHYMRYHRALEDGDAQRAARIFERTNAWSSASGVSTGLMHPAGQPTVAGGGDTGGHPHVFSGREELGGVASVVSAGGNNSAQLLLRKEDPLQGTLHDVAGNLAFDELDVTSPATKIQRDFTAPALGPIWQARVVRSVRVVCGRGALMCRKDLGARIVRELCRLLERSDLENVAPEPRPALEALREACGDTLTSVAYQLGPDLFAPFERAAAKALALGPQGTSSKAATRWAMVYAERMGNQRTYAGGHAVGLIRDSSDDRLSESTLAGSQNDDDASELGEDPGAGSFFGARPRRASSVDARFEDAAVDEISAVARRAGQRDAPATAFRRHRTTGGRGRPPSLGGSHGAMQSGGGRGDAYAAGSAVNDDVRRSELPSAGDKPQPQSGSGSDGGTRQRLHVNQPNLQKAWDVSQRLTADDWNDWLRRLSLELLRESPSAALRSCATVAHAHPRLARQLFQPAFVSCWLELDDGYRDSLVRTLEAAFRSNELHAVAPDALQLLLDLAEFMERDVDALPIDIRVLADLATKCRAYAKALHYKELEYRTPELARDRHAAAEALIAINRKLAQPEAALGVLHATRRRCLAGGRRVTRHRDIAAENAARFASAEGISGDGGHVPAHSSISPPPRSMEGDDDDDEMLHPPAMLATISSRHEVVHAQQLSEPASAASTDDRHSHDHSREDDGYAKWGVSESWLGKLGSHEEALALYQRRLENDACDVEAILGAMKSLDALGDWQRACTLLVSTWPKLQQQQQQQQHQSHHHHHHNHQQQRATVTATPERMFSTEVAPTQAGTPNWRTLNSQVPSLMASSNFSSRVDVQGYATSVLPPPQSPDLLGSSMSKSAGDLSAVETVGPTMRNPSSRETRLLMKAANVGARAAWSLGRWDDMAIFVDVMEDDDGSKPFYRAILALRPRENADVENFDAVADLINDARRGLHSTFAALVAESYKRAYQTMVMVQQLSELEEIVDLRKAEYEARAESISSTPHVLTNVWSTIAEQREQLVTRWRRRLAGCPQDVSTWQRILNVRSLVLSFSDDPETWLRYASLCRHSGQSSMSDAVLTQQLGFDAMSVPTPAAAWTLGEHRLRYAYAKHAWAAGKRGEALKMVEELADALGELSFEIDVPRELSLSEKAELRTGAPRLRAKCLLRLGDWRLAKRCDDENRHRNSGIGTFSWNSAAVSGLSMNHAEPPHFTSCAAPEDEFPLMAPFFELATHLDPMSYKAWHAWALVNYRAVQRSWAARQTTIPRRSTRSRRQHPNLDEAASSMGSRDERSLRHTRLVAAASAFVRAIALGRRRWAASVQQDLLNLLNLWFRFGRQSDVEALLLADCDQDEFLDSNLEDDNDDAAFLAAAAAARASPLHQPPINAETKADPVNNAAAAAREIQAGSAPHVTTTSLLSSAVRAHAPGVRPFTPPPRPYSPLSSSTGGRRTGIRGTPLDAWLGVLPQLIARIGASDASPRSALHRLLARLGARHPQALVYPLSLQLKSPRDERRTAAAAILLAPRRVAPQLVEQALLVSEELIRVAILWHEKWHEGLEEASRLYFGDADVDAMLAILRPLHAELEAGPHTMREHAFQQAFGRDLADASRCLDEYERAAEALAKLPPASTSRKSSKNTARRARRRGSRERGPVSEEQSAAAMAGGNRADEIEPGGVSGSQEPGSSNDDEEARKRLRNQMDSALNQAWDLYYTVFRRVNKQLPQLTMLELKYVSPALVNARNLELAVPGTYRVDGTAARILRFGSAVHVITSKQRPRRLAMRGSDGREYGFLLKGHEDLRQDERAMQLFGLANALLAKDRRTCEHGHLLIQRYAVTPLSHNCGVVGWVPASDTLHALVRDFREARKIVLNVEHRVMLQLAPDYDALTLAQKVEVFEAALADVAGQDLSKVLWLKSAHSEQWLERRTHYTRSLATMSMVGHILGLGDRHPSNLMLDRRTGKILHIDFGDCFEVAMHRDKFPERVPFRLTRMLVNAMEVSGVEGTFRSSCERVMRVLRHNRDSLLSMLEAFIHDPLISWRLLGGTVEPEIGDLSEKPGTNLSGDPSVDATKSGSARRDDGARSSTGRDSMSATRDDGRSDEDDEDEGDDGDDEEDRVRSELKEGREDESDDQSDDDDDEVGSDDGRSDNEEEHTDDEYRSYAESGETESRDTSRETGVSHRSSIRAAASERRSQGRIEPNGAHDSTSTAAGSVAPSSDKRARSRVGIAASVSRVSQQQQQQRSSMHLKMSRMAASLSANSTRYSAHSVHDASNSRGNRNSVVGSIANSRLDHRSARERDLVQTLGEEGAEAPIEVLNEKAVAVMARVEDKLTGCDFDDAGALSIVEQVDRLIQQATDVQNLCQAFVGWCPFW